MKCLQVLFVTLFGIVFFLLFLFILYSYLNETNGEIESSGEIRKYLLHVPDSYQEGEPTALVISLHGFASWPAQQRDLTQFSEVADEHGFIIVYPSGSGFPMRWQTGDYGNRDPMMDIIFIDDLINELLDEFTIDPRHIYINGYSSGGGMTYLLACTMAERIAAIGTVAGSYDFPGENCNPSQAVPVIAFHGTDDRFVPYEGGFVSPPGYMLPAVIDWVHLWAIRNDCITDPVTLVQVGDVEGIKYSGCKTDTEIHFYTVNGGGHTWPGGQPLPEFIVGHTTMDVSASELMWSFFSNFELADEMQ